MQAEMVCCGLMSMQQLLPICANCDSTAPPTGLEQLETQLLFRLLQLSWYNQASCHNSVVTAGQLEPSWRPFETIQLLQLGPTGQLSTSCPSVCYNWGGPTGNN